MLPLKATNLNELTNSSAFVYALQTTYIFNGIPSSYFKICTFAKFLPFDTLNSSLLYSLTLLAGLIPFGSLLDELC